MYGSIFCSVTRKPRASRSDPIEAAAGAGSVRIAQPCDEGAPLGEGVTETRERFAREREPLERRRRDRLRLVTGDGQRAELDRLDAEAARPHPRERPGQLGDEVRGRGGEAVTRVQETEGAARSEPRERQLGARPGEDPLQPRGGPPPPEPRAPPQPQS